MACRIGLTHTAIANRPGVKARSGLVYRYRGVPPGIQVGNPLRGEQPPSWAFRSEFAT